LQKLCFSTWKPQCLPHYPHGEGVQIPLFREIGYLRNFSLYTAKIVFLTTPYFSANFSAIWCGAHINHKTE
jgi:hypothetical protein